MAWVDIHLCMLSKSMFSLQKYIPIMAYSFSCVRFILWCSSQAVFKVISNKCLINSQLEHLTTAPQPPGLLSPPSTGLEQTRRIGKFTFFFLMKKKSPSWSREAVSRMHTETTSVWMSSGEGNCWWARRGHIKRSLWRGNKNTNKPNDAYWYHRATRSGFDDAREIWHRVFFFSLPRFKVSPQRSS